MLKSFECSFSQNFSLLISFLSELPTLFPAVSEHLWESTHGQRIEKMRDSRILCRISHSRFQNWVPKYATNIYFTKTEIEKYCCNIFREYVFPNIWKLIRKNVARLKMQYLRLNLKKKKTILFRIFAPIINVYPCPVLEFGIGAIISFRQRSNESYESTRRFLSMHLRHARWVFSSVVTRLQQQYKILFA